MGVLEVCLVIITIFLVATLSVVLFFFGLIISLIYKVKKTIVAFSLPAFLFDVLKRRGSK